MQNLHRLLALLVVTALFGLTTALSQIPTLAPSIPTSGAIGAGVVLTGTNFSSTPASNVVRFGGGVQGTVTVASPTSLTVTVPVGAVYGKITVTVGGLTAYSRNPFDVTFPYSGPVDTAMFAQPVDFSTSATWPSLIDVGDFDGDGKSDVVVSNNEPSTSSISVFRNTGTKGVVNGSTFAAAQNLPTTTNGRPWGIAVGDFDGDGKLDIAVANGSTNNVSIFRNTSSGPGTVSFGARIDSAAGPGPHDLVVADIDLDGRPDIILTNYNGGGAGSISILRNTSTIGTISFAAHADYTVDDGPRGLTVGDIDVDGLPDIAVACFSSGTIYLLKNSSSPGSLSFEIKPQLTSVLTPVSVAINDFDRDGLPDVIASGYGDGVWLYRVEGSFSGWETPAIYHKAPGQGSVAGADLDGDGKADILTANALEASYNRGTLTVFKNLQPGSGSFITSSFSDSVNFTLPSLPYQAAVADVDGDGRPDLIGANIYGASLSVLRNRTADTLIVTATAVGGGTITPSGAVKVPHGQNATFAIAATGGNHIDSVVVDGVNRYVLSSLTLDTVEVNHTVTAYFSAGTVFAITSSAGAGGSIAPLGVVNVPSGTNQTYTITQNPGYVLDSLIVDAVKVDSSLTYTFTGVIATHTIRATFKTSCKVTPKFFLGGAAAADTMKLALKTNGALAAHFTGAKIPALAVDSVTIEVRNAQTAAGSTIRKFAPAWLLSDGSIRAFADTAQTSVAFDVLGGAYYMVVYHRNHLSVMTAAAATLVNGATAFYDFTTGQGQAFGSIPMVLVGTKYCLIPGDADGSGVVDAGDRSATWNQRNLSGYYREDCDLSGVVDAGDRSMTWNSRNAVSQVP
jgi:hypothetical protein